MKANLLLDIYKELKSEYPEITDVSYGIPTEKGHKLLDQRCIIVGVDKKYKYPQFKGRQVLPSKYIDPDGVEYRIDVEEVNVEKTANDINHLEEIPTKFIYQRVSDTKTYGGSGGPILKHEIYGKVRLTNRHVANLFPHDSHWYTKGLDGQDKPYAKIVEVAQENVDAAIFKLDDQSVKTHADIGVHYGAPIVGQEVYYYGANSQKIKTGTILSIGWGKVEDRYEPDGEFVTSNFKFMNLKGTGTAAPIPGDSGSAVFTDVNQVTYCLGIIYAKGDRNEYAVACPYPDIQDQFDGLDWGEVTSGNNITLVDEIINLKNIVNDYKIQNNQLRNKLEEAERLRQQAVEAAISPVEDTDVDELIDMVKQYHKDIFAGYRGASARTRNILKALNKIKKTM